MCHRCREVGATTNQVSGVQFNEERNEQHQKKGQFILNYKYKHNEFPHGFTLTSRLGQNVGLGEG